MDRLYTVVLFVVFGYVSGSILYGKIFPKIMCGTDIMAISADGNPGTANVFAHCGVKCGIATGMAEFWKGFFPVALACNFIKFETGGIEVAMIIMAPALGHMTSVMNHFNGGIGIAPTMGSMIAVFMMNQILVVLVAFYALNKFVIKHKTNAKRTMFVFFMFIIFLCFTPDSAFRTAYLTLSILIWIRGFLKSRHPIEAEGRASA